MHASVAMWRGGANGQGVWCTIPHVHAWWLTMVCKNMVPPSTTPTHKPLLLYLNITYVINSNLAYLYAALCLVTMASHAWALNISEHARSSQGLGDQVWSWVHPGNACSWIPSINPTTNIIITCDTYAAVSFNCSSSLLALTKQRYACFHDTPCKVSLGFSDMLGKTQPIEVL